LVFKFCFQSLNEKSKNLVRFQILLSKFKNAKSKNLVRFQILQLVEVDSLDHSHVEEKTIHGTIEDLKEIINNWFYLAENFLKNWRLLIENFKSQ